MVVADFANDVQQDVVVERRQKNLVEEIEDKRPLERVLSWLQSFSELFC